MNHTNNTVREITPISKIDVVELTQQLIQFDTRNPPGNERECAEFVGGILKEAGFEVNYYEYDDKRTSLVARIGGIEGQKRIAFAGHIDTVPFGTAPWKVDPLAAEIIDGKLYGRGSTDMKSGVAAFIGALTSIAPELVDTCGVELVITAGEETGCDGSYHLASLDGALGDVGALVVAEPSYNKPLAGHKGAIWLEGVARGKTAHGSMPELGINAVVKAATAVIKLDAYDFNVPEHISFGKPTVNVGNIAGGQNINSVPDYARIGIDIRTIESQSHEQVIDDVTDYLGDQIELSQVVNVRSVWTTPTDPWLQSVKEIIESVTEVSSDFCLVPFFTDAGPLKPAYGKPPTIVVGPGETHLAHQTDEYCFVQNIIDAEEIYIRIARQWCLH